MTPPFDGQTHATSLRPLLRIVPYYKRYGLAYGLGFGALVAAIWLRLAIPRLLGDSISNLEAAALEGGRLDAERGAELLGTAVFWIVIVAIAGAVTRVTSRWTILGTSRRVVHDLREELYAKLTRLSPSFYLRTTTGQLMSRGMNDVQHVQGLTGPVFLYIAETLLLYGIGLTMMISVSAELTFWALLPFPFFLWRARILAQAIQIGSRAAQQSMGEISDKISESLGGSLVIKTMGLEGADRGRFEAHAQHYRDLNLEVTRARIKLWPMMMILAALSTAITLGIGIPRALRGEIETGDFVAFLFYLQLLAAPTAVLGFVISSLQRGAASLARLGEVLDAEETLPDPADPLAFEGLSGGVELRGLTIDRGDERAALSDDEGSRGQAAPRRRILDAVDLRLEAGQTLGIVGRTGSGKTTLMNVLARLTEVERGVLFYDGIDATRLKPSTVRAGIALVPQDPFLFSASLAENIALGSHGASSEEIDEAVRISQLGSDLAQLPEGLATLVGERGVNLSGGQRQRTALARAVLVRPSLLLLDDTLSAVDTATADAILAGLEPIMRERTTVIVAHRLSTVRHADLIVVLEDGAISESGTHGDLLAAGGTYAELWRSQEEQPASDDRQPNSVPTGGPS